MKATKRTGTRALALLAVASLGLAACSSSKTSTASSGGGGKSVKLGFFGALSGSNAALGTNILDGEKLAVAQYMSTHPSVAVTVDAFDSQGDPSQASNGAQKLISDGDVAVIGPAFSGESKVADPIFEQAGIPNISASATNVALAQNGWKYFHRVLADDSYQGKGDADYLVKTLNKSNIFVIDDNSTYGAGLASYVSAQVTADGAKVAGSDHVDPKGSDYSTTVNKVITSNADAVFFGGYYDAAGRLINQLKAAGFKGAFMSGDGSEDPHFVADAGGATNADGAYLSCPCADETQNPSASSFVNAYKAMFGQEPAIYSAEAYDAANMVLAAIKAGNTTPSAINQWLATNTFTGITKTIKFQPNGNIAGGTIYVYQVKNGTITEIGTTN